MKESTNVSLLHHHPLVLSESFCGKVTGWSAMDAFAPQPVVKKVDRKRGAGLGHACCWRFVVRNTLARLRCVSKSSGSNVVRRKRWAGRVLVG